MQSSWGVILALAIIGAFALLLLASLRRSRLSAAKKQDSAALLGLRHLSTPDPSLLQRIAPLLHRTGASGLELRNVYQRKLPDGELYLFDLWDTSGESSSSVCDSAFALLSPALALPRLSLLPRLEETGKLAGLANRFIGWAASQSLPHIDFDGPFDFVQNYLVFGLDESAVRSFLDDILRSRLAHLKGVGIEMEGELIIVSDAFRRITSPAGQPIELSSELDRALTVFHMFQHR
jgi:hypothetical protein